MNFCPFLQARVITGANPIGYTGFGFHYLVLFFLCSSGNASIDNAIANYCHRYSWRCVHLPLNWLNWWTCNPHVIHIFLYIPFPDPCKTEGCNAPFNIGCRVVNNKAQCICPTCPNILKPVCTSDHVQDLSECHMKRQACELNIDVAVEKQGPCGTLGFFALITYRFFLITLKVVSFSKD